MAFLQPAANLTIVLTASEPDPHVQYNSLKQDMRKIIDLFNLTWMPLWALIMLSLALNFML